MVKLISGLLLCSFMIAAPVYADSSISSAPKAASAITLKSMSAAQLKAFDGKNGHKAYVALNGKVYDVTNIDEWKGGKHYKGMVAGTDLTPYISQSPHGAKIVNELELTPVATYKK
jgi:predicted heme/steroid binding protein